MSHEQSAADALARAKDVHGVARILVNCAGIAPVIKTAARDDVAYPINTYRKTSEIILINTFITIGKFAALLSGPGPVDEEQSVIINTTSVAADNGRIWQAAYASSKGIVVRSDGAGRTARL